MRSELSAWLQAQKQVSERRCQSTPSIRDCRKKFQGDLPRAGVFVGSGLRPPRDRKAAAQGPHLR